MSILHFLVEGNGDQKYLRIRKLEEDEDPFDGRMRVTLDLTNFPDHHAEILLDPACSERHGLIGDDICPVCDKPVSEPLTTIKLEGVVVERGSIKPSNNRLQCTLLLEKGAVLRIGSRIERWRDVLCGSWLTIHEDCGNILVHDRPRCLTYTS